MPLGFGAIGEFAIGQTSKYEVITEIVGAFDAVETEDVANIAVEVIAEGALAANEGSDNAAILGDVAWIGVLAATEDADIADAAGFVETAVVTDWKFPTAHSIISGGGWVNPQNVYAKDGAITEAHHDEVGADWFLKTEGFGIGPAIIPDDAIILKVELEVKWNVSPP